jgi:hypothetical protein
MESDNKRGIVISVYSIEHPKYGRESRTRPDLRGAMCNECNLNNREVEVACTKV